MQMLRETFLVGLTAELQLALRTSGELEGSALVSSDGYRGTDLPAHFLAAVAEIEGTVEFLRKLHSWRDGYLSDRDIYRCLLAGLFVAELRDLADRMAKTSRNLKELESFGRLDRIERDEQDQPVRLQEASVEMQRL